MLRGKWATRRTELRGSCPRWPPPWIVRRRGRRRGRSTAAAAWIVRGERRSRQDAGRRGARARRGGGRRRGVAAISTEYPRNIRGGTAISTEYSRRRPPRRRVAGPAAERFHPSQTGDASTLTGAGSGTGGLDQLLFYGGYEFDARGRPPYVSRGGRGEPSDGFAGEAEIWFLRRLLLLGSVPRALAVAADENFVHSDMCVEEARATALD